MNTYQIATGMKKINWQALALAAAFLLGSCHTPYQVTSVSGSTLAVDRQWDGPESVDARALIAPYKDRLSDTMANVIGRSAKSMTSNRPEDLLSNLAADVLRTEAARVLGQPADIGIMNIGGLRNVLNRGDVRVQDAFEIFPFENSLCVVYLKGLQVKKLFAQMAARGGEGLSGANLVIRKDGTLLDCQVEHQPIDDNRLYTIGTIDYVAEGNDGLSAIKEQQSRVCPDGAILRDIFIDYVKRLTTQGKELDAAIEGRIVVQP